MFRIALAIALFACTATPAPVVPTSPPQNAAAYHASTIPGAGDVACFPLRTSAKAEKSGDAPPPDTAICETRKILLFCWSGKGKGSDCEAFANFNPPPPKQPEAPEAKTDDKKPDPPPKPEPKKK